MQSHLNVPTKTLRLLSVAGGGCSRPPAKGDCHGNSSYSRLGKQTDIEQIYSTGQLGRDTGRPAALLPCTPRQLIRDLLCPTRALVTCQRPFIIAHVLGALPFLTPLQSGPHRLRSQSESSEGSSLALKSPRAGPRRQSGACAGESTGHFPPSLPLLMDTEPDLLGTWPMRHSFRRGSPRNIIAVTILASACRFSKLLLPFQVPPPHTVCKKAERERAFIILPFSPQGDSPSIWPAARKAFPFSHGLLMAFKMVFTAGFIEHFMEHTKLPA